MNLLPLLTSLQDRCCYCCAAAAAVVVLLEGQRTYCCFTPSFRSLLSALSGDPALKKTPETVRGQSRELSIQ